MKNRHKHKHGHNPQKRCSICRKWFQPDARTRQQQQCCNNPACRKERKKRADKSWQKRHPWYGRSRRLKIQAWAANYPDYWQQYRRAHPAYCVRDNERRRESRQHVQNAAKQDEMREIAVEKLQNIPRIEPRTAAKQVLMDRRVDTVIECLLGLMCAAKQDKIELVPCSAVDYPHGTTDMGRNQAAETG